LAEEGQNLWKKLFQGKIEGSLFDVGEWLRTHPLEKDGIIQVTFSERTKDFVFPWALLYDKSLPNNRYSYPDPEGFWGFRFCIEQIHANERGVDRALELSDKLRLAFMLWEQFPNARDQINLMNDLTKRSHGKINIVGPITEKETCFSQLEKGDANVLYFYTHGHTKLPAIDAPDSNKFERFFKTFYGDFDTDDPRRKLYESIKKSIERGQFEIDKTWIELTSGKLLLDDLRGRLTKKFECKPFVILNMCESAQVLPSMSDNLVDFFIDRGASGVVGSECPMTIMFAHPFAEYFLKSLLAGREIGFALLETRRYFAEKFRNPLGLAYTLFGPAIIHFESSAFDTEGDSFVASCNGDAGAR
jgi:hypothetical protein